MNISVIGTGYVGLVTGTLFADRGNRVICVDNNSKLIEQLNNGKIHIFEPGLEELVRKSVAQNNLSFKTLAVAHKSKLNFFPGLIAEKNLSFQRPCISNH